MNILGELKQKYDALAVERGKAEQARREEYARKKRELLERLRQEYTQKAEAGMRELQETVGSIGPNEEHVLRNMENVEASLIEAMQHARKRRVSIRQITRELLGDDNGGNQRYVKQILHGERTFRESYNPVKMLFGDEPIAGVDFPEDAE